MISESDADARLEGMRPSPLVLRRRSTWLGRLTWLLVVIVAIVFLVGMAKHPSELPQSDERVTASIPVGDSVFLGVFAARADFGRTIHISGVKVYATSTVEVTITPHLCRGGSLGVTREPELFCTDVVDVEGAVMRPGDEVILEVRADQPGVVAIDPIRIGYRDGLQWDTQRAGAASLVTVLGR
ncbi:hypothetical protein [Nocardioides sp.]|uniref:hypothetical protein n=1 Tax=Nocardioides sp. TaxID=35761 RepID=UPI003564DBDE